MYNINPIYLEEIKRDFIYRLSRMNPRNTSTLGLMATSTGVLPTLVGMANAAANNPNPIAGAAKTLAAAGILGAGNAIGREAPRIAQGVRVKRIAQNLTDKNGLKPSSEQIKRFARKFRINSDKNKFIFNLQKMAKNGESLSELKYLIYQYGDKLDYKQLKDAIYKTNLESDIKKKLLDFIISEYRQFR